MLRQFLLIILMVAATPLAAQDTSRMTFGGDVYAAGRTAEVGETVDGDLFAAGNRVEVNGEVALAVLARGVLRVAQVGVVDGQISRLYFHSNPDKLTRLALPEGFAPA